jgi:hypothetical protein
MGVLYQLRNNFHFRDRHIFVKLFKQYMRPHLEFATPAWSPWLAADKQVLENVQKKFVNMIAGLKPGTYEDKCKEIGLETLEERREVQDLAQTYKMIQGKEKLKKELFSHVDGGRTRQDGDPLNLKQKPARLEIRRNFFTQGAVKKCIAIPAVKPAKNVKQFKMNYQKNCSGMDQVEGQWRTEQKTTDDGQPPTSQDGPNRGAGILHTSNK